MVASKIQGYDLKCGHLPRPLKVWKSVKNEKMKMAESSRNVKCIKQFKFFPIFASSLVHKNITLGILNFDAKIYWVFH